VEPSLQSIADELMSQIEQRLPPRPLVGGGFHHFVINASAQAEISLLDSLDVLDVLSRRLANECPEWRTEIHGRLSALQVIFSR
jgi:hypothetical protein